MTCLRIKLFSVTLLAAGLTFAASAADKEKAEPIKLVKAFEVDAAKFGVPSPDGKIVAVTVMEKFEKKAGNNQFGGVYHRTRILDAATGKELAVIPGGEVNRFTNNGKSLAVSQTFQEQYLKSANVNMAAPSPLLFMMPMPQMWDVSKPEKPKQLFVVDGALGERFSPDSKLVAVNGGPEGKFGNAGKVVTGLPKTGKAGAGPMGGLGGGGFGVGGMSMQFVEIWEVDTAKFVARYQPLAKDKGGASYPVWSPDNKFLAVQLTTKDSTKLSLYDVEKKKEARSINLEGNRVQAGSIFTFAPDPIEPVQFLTLPKESIGDTGMTVLAVAVQGKAGSLLNLYDPATGKLIETLINEKVADKTLTQIDYCGSPNGMALATNVIKSVAGGFQGLPAPGGVQPPVGGFGGPAVPGLGGKAAPAPGGKPVAPPANPAEQPGLGGIGGGNPFGGMGGFGIKSNAGTEVVLWDMQKRAKRLTIKVQAQHMVFVSDDVLATVGIDGDAQKLKLWDVASGQELANLDHCIGVRFSADGTTMVTRCGDLQAQKVQVWTLERAKK
ncbi:MAG: hypothetical protein K2R98_02030 [Gemmataceae bacterium]|nr:hypothetical protein [Gemmataceae bacterium]